MQMRDVKSGRFLGRYEALSKKMALKASQVGQSPFEAALTELESKINDDSPAVQSYLQQLVVLVRDQSSSAATLRRAIPIIEETVRLAQKEDPSLTDAEKKRIGVAGRSLITFIEDRTNLLQRAKTAVQAALSGRIQRIRTGVGDALEGNSSLVLRGVAQALRQRPSTSSSVDESGLLKAQSDLYGNVHARRQSAPESSPRFPAESIPDALPSEDTTPKRQRKSNGPLPNKVLTQILTTDKSILTELKGIYALMHRTDERAIATNEQSQRDEDNRSRKPQRITDNTVQPTQRKPSFASGMINSLLDFGRRLMTGLFSGLSRLIGPSLSAILGGIGTAIMPALSAVARVLGPIAAAIATLYAAFKGTRFLDKMTNGAISDVAGKGFSAITGAISGFSANGIGGIVSGASDAMQNYDDSRKAAKQDPNWHDKEDAAMWNGTKKAVGLGSEPVGEPVAAPTVPPSPSRTMPSADKKMSMAPMGRSPERVKTGTQIDMVRSALARQGYDDPEVQANILGQIGRETGGSFTGKDENLNYSYDRFKTVYGKRKEFQGLSNAQLRERFTEAKQSGPEAIAELVYGANTKKGKELGNVESGDGYRYRGRGLIQITGRKNYRDLSKQLQSQGIDVDLEKHPELVNRPDISADVVPAFFALNGKKQESLRDMKAATQAVTGHVSGAMGQEQLQSAEKYAAQFTASPNEVRSAMPIVKAQKAIDDNKSSTIVIAPTSVTQKGGSGSGGNTTMVPVPIVADNPNDILRAISKINGI